MRLTVMPETTVMQGGEVTLDGVLPEEIAASLTDFAQAEELIEAILREMKDRGHDV